MNRLNTMLTIVGAASIWLLAAMSSLADKPSTYQDQLSASCVKHGLAASCSLQEAYSAQLDCREAGLPANCSIMELTHTR